jgi:hypothetical protein
VSDVCLNGADLARRLGHIEIALRWLEVGRAEPSCTLAVIEQLDAIRKECLLLQPSGEQAAASIEPRPNESDTPREVTAHAEVTERGSNAGEDGLEIPLVRRRSEQPIDGANPPSTIDQALISPESDPNSLKEATERATFMMTHASPSYQTLTLLRRWLRRWPSSTKLMEYVRDAAFVERDIPLSRAVEHVRCVLANLSERLEPPDLGSQPIVPEAVRSLLTRDVTCATSEALAVIGETGERFLQRDLADFGVTGLDRIIPNSATPLGQAFGEVSARIGLLRTPLFHKRGNQPARASLALASPTALLVEGELPRKEAELVGLIAGPLWVTQPEYSIIMGAPAQQARAIIVALQVAFGPPQRRPPTNYGEALKIAEKLWETIPPAAQRRLRDLCVESLDYGRALEFSRRVDRRAGLYATGDFGWSLAQLSQQQQRDVSTTILDQNVAEQDPNAADLLRLATSAEYAAIRWQPSRGSELRILVHPR